MNQPVKAAESAETLADRRKVQEGYALVNAMWKTQGAAATLRYVHHLPHGRALGSGSSFRKSTGSSQAATASIAAAIATGQRNGSRPATSTWSAAARRWRAAIARPPAR